MPEGDSLYRLAKRLAPALEGRTVTAVAARQLSTEAARSLVGQRITSVSSLGKNLLIALADGRCLHIHLKMRGRVYVERPRSAFWAPERSPPDLRLVVDGAAIVGRRLPILRLLPRTEAGAPRGLSDLGPDLVRPHWDEDEAVRRLRALSDRPIADALLVQRAAAGIGNVYKCEVLFLERVDPRAPLSALPDERLRRLLRRASLLLQRNLGDGPRTTRPSLGGPRLWVYGRSGRPCLRCGETVVRFVQTRSTYACPSCQRGAPDDEARP